MRQVNVIPVVATAPHHHYRAIWKNQLQCVRVRSRANSGKTQGQHSTARTTESASQRSSSVYQIYAVRVTGAGLISPPSPCASWPSCGLILIPRFLKPACGPRAEPSLTQTSSGVEAASLKPPPHRIGEYPPTQSVRGGEEDEALPME